MKNDYKLTECCFQETLWNNKKLYSVKTMIVKISDPSKRTPRVVGLGDDFDRVKRIARAHYSGAILPASLKSECYSSIKPFYTKDCSKNGKIDVERSSDGNPILQTKWKTLSVGYYPPEESRFEYLGYNVDKAFEYEASKGNIIMAEKNGDEWCLPHNWENILNARLSYNTHSLSKEELLR